MIINLGFDIASFPTPLLDDMAIVSFLSEITLCLIVGNKFRQLGLSINDHFRHSQIHSIYTDKAL